MTNEQIKELWEACGFKFFQPVEGGAIDVIDPSGDCYLSPTKLAYPPADLNNLFKWVAPILQDKGYMVELYSYEQMGYKVSIYNITGQVDIPITIIEAKDPAVALFWACYKVLVRGKG